MSKESILVIEDEKNIVELVKYNLEQEGYRVQTAFRGDDGLEKARKCSPDLIVLDWMIPGLDGLEVCKLLRKDYRTSSIAIVMLTAKSQETDKVIGLEFGADDYVTKPFSPRELCARIKAVLRRSREKMAETIHRVGSLEMDTAKHSVALKGKEMVLTSKEYDLLQTLIEANGRALSREFLLNRVWGYDESLEIETRTVDMHIGQLRKKLKQEASRLVTIKNLGYRLDQGD